MENSAPPAPPFAILTAIMTSLGASYKALPPCTVESVGISNTGSLCCPGTPSVSLSSMGLGVELVKRVFSKDRSRSSERSHGVDKGKWAVARFKLCGDDFDPIPVDDDSDTCRSSEATVTQPLTEQASETTIRVSIVEDPQSEQATRVLEEEGVVEQEEIASLEVLGEEEAAITIQSAFRGFQARHQYKHIQQPTESDGEERMEKLSKVSVCTSTEVQAGDSTENSIVQDANSNAQHRLQHKARAHIPKLKEDWDSSTVSSNISKLRIQNRLEAMTRRERALAYAFSQQLRTCSTKKKAMQNESDEPNMGWTWLERWMATRALDNSLVGECMSKNLEPISSSRRYSIIRKTLDVSVEEMESCGSNDVSVCFENIGVPSKNNGEMHRPARNRLKVTRNLSQRKRVPNYHYMLQADNATRRDSSRETQKDKEGNVAQAHEGSSVKMLP